MLLYLPVQLQFHIIAETFLILSPFLTFSLIFTSESSWIYFNFTLWSSYQMHLQNLLKYGRFPVVKTKINDKLWSYFICSFYAWHDNSLCDTVLLVFHYIIHCSLLQTVHGSNWIILTVCFILVINNGIVLLVVRHALAAIKTLLNFLTSFSRCFFFFPISTNEENEIKSPIHSVEVCSFLWLLFFPHLQLQSWHSFFLSRSMLCHLFPPFMKNQLLNCGLKLLVSLGFALLP